MSNGPALLFDKSTIQRLSADQASWLMHFFRGVITPVFMAEVLGNLAKDFKGRMQPHQVVASLASKCRGIGTMPNVSHLTAIEGELSGYPVEMRGVPVVGGGQRFEVNGEPGVFFDESPEERVLRRWRPGEFEEAERDRAAAWRIATKQIDLSDLPRSFHLDKAQRAQIATVADAVRMTDVLLSDDSARYRTVDTALSVFDIDPRLARAVRDHWPRWGRPPLRHFAPYTYYALRVLTAFTLRVASRAIPERPTNLVDLQYVFYFPFCGAFTSGDKLHREFAGSFLNKRQTFLWAEDLQPALSELVAYYDANRDELRARGRAFFAAYPPLELNTEIHRAYDHSFPDWRKQAAIPHKPPTKEESEAIMAKLKPAMDAMARMRPT